MKSVSMIMVSSLFAANAWASEVTYDYATVVDAEPILKTVRVTTPRTECWDEEVTYRRPEHHDNGAGAVVGGVIGGALGNAVGHKKRNKQVGAVVGAVLGATVGHAVANQNRGERVTRDVEEVCEVYRDSHSEERVVGYRVTYRYNNSEYVTRTSELPGETLKLRIAISPVI